MTTREVHVLFLNDDKEQLWVKLSDKNVIPLCSVEEFAQLRVVAMVRLPPQSLASRIHCRPVGSVTRTWRSR